MIQASASDVRLVVDFGVVAYPAEWLRAVAAGSNCRQYGYDGLSFGTWRLHLKTFVSCFCYYYCVCLFCFVVVVVVVGCGGVVTLC